VHTTEWSTCLFTLPTHATKSHKQNYHSVHEQCKSTFFSTLFLIVLASLVQFQPNPTTNKGQLWILLCDLFIFKTIWDLTMMLFWINSQYIHDFLFTFNYDVYINWIGGNIYGDHAWWETFLAALKLKKTPNFK